MPTRRHFLQLAAAGSAIVSPLAALAQERRFAPQPGDWRTFEVTTRVDVTLPHGAPRVWLPIPSVDTEWQRSGESSFSSNGKATRTVEAREGAGILQVDFDASVDQPFVELTSRVQTRNRAVDWARKSPVAMDATSRAYWLSPTALIPTDGIVRDTARKAVGDARTDEDKVRRIYDWVVGNAWREPTVRGCGEGNVKTMPETGNLGGKCADINALFVGLFRAEGIPASD